MNNQPVTLYQVIDCILIENIAPHSHSVKSQIAANRETYQLQLHPYVILKLIYVLFIYLFMFLLSSPE